MSAISINDPGGPVGTTKDLIAKARALSPFKTQYDLFLECVKNTGAYAVYGATEIKDGRQVVRDKTETLIPKGSTTHGIAAHELIDFRPLSRKERRYLDGKRRRL